MAFDAASIISDVSLDIRAVLGTTGGDSTLILGWVDRIQKDLLHTSIYRHCASAVESVTTSATTTNYAMTTHSIRRIEMVYDRTFQNTLQPIDNILSPEFAGYPNESPAQPDNSELADALSRIKTGLQFPAFYKLQSSVSAGVMTHTLYIFPAPSATAFAGVLDVHYRAVAPNITATSDVLVLPADARDAVVSGVNWLAMMYLKRTEDAQLWKATYNEAKGVAL